MKLHILIFILIFSIQIVSAETIIYENSYKTIQITDAANIPVVNEYKYDVYFNDTWIGRYEKYENIYIPDGTNVSINIVSPVLTNPQDTYTVGKSILIVGVMGFFGVFIIILSIIIIARWLLRRRR